MGALLFLSGILWYNSHSEAVAFEELLAGRSPLRREPHRNSYRLCRLYGTMAWDALHSPAKVRSAAAYGKEGNH